MSFILSDDEVSTDDEKITDYFHVSNANVHLEQIGHNNYGKKNKTEISLTQNSGVGNMTNHICNTINPGIEHK